MAEHLGISEGSRVVVSNQDGKLSIQPSGRRDPIEGPVELVNGKLLLRIPLAAGSDKLVGCSRSIDTADGEFLTIAIDRRLVDCNGIGEGSRVVVSNMDGKLDVQPK